MVMLMVKLMETLMVKHLAMQTEIHWELLKAMLMVILMVKQWGTLMDMLWATRLVKMSAPELEKLSARRWL